MTLEQAEMSFINVKLKFVVVEAEHYPQHILQMQHSSWLKILPLTAGVFLVCLLAKYLLNHLSDFNKTF